MPFSKTAQVSGPLIAVSAHSQPMTSQVGSFQKHDTNCCRISLVPLHQWLFKPSCCFRAFNPTLSRKQLLPFFSSVRVIEQVGLLLQCLFSLSRCLCVVNETRTGWSDTAVADQNHPTPSTIFLLCYSVCSKLSDSIVRVTQTGTNIYIINIIS